MIKILQIIVVFLMQCSILFASNLFAATGDCKSTFIRTVACNRLQKQEVADDFTFDSKYEDVDTVLKNESSDNKTTAVTSGIVAKNYNSGTLAGGTTENVGLAVYLKDNATLSQGGESAITTLHRHADSTKTTANGISMFGDVTNAIHISGTQTNLFKLRSGNEGISTGSTKTSPSTVDKWIVIEIAGTTYYMPCYTSKTS
ncbi:MAG: hypothetical protein ACFFE4_00500 [Candidatus Thorarchaeota archaeon]